MGWHLTIIISHPFPGKGIALFKEACRQQLEGIMTKRADSPYLIGKRSRNWLKVKGRHVTTCYIVGEKGYQEP